VTVYFVSFVAGDSPNAASFFDATFEYDERVTAANVRDALAKWRAVLMEKTGLTFVVILGFQEVPA
jgi:hypothetical protein